MIGSSPDLGRGHGYNEMKLNIGNNVSTLVALAGIFAISWDLTWAFRLRLCTNPTQYIPFHLSEDSVKIARHSDCKGNWSCQVSWLDKDIGSSLILSEIAGPSSSGLLILTGNGTLEFLAFFCALPGDEGLFLHAKHVLSHRATAPS